MSDNKKRRSDEIDSPIPVNPQGDFRIQVTGWELDHHHLEISHRSCREKMKKDVEYFRKNLEAASDLIARKYRVRDEYLLGQPYYLDLLGYTIDVLAEYRGQGVGKMLIEELKRICAERNVCKMFVLTHEENESAMRLYQSTGGKRDIPDNVLFEYKEK